MYDDESVSHVFRSRHFWSSSSPNTNTLGWQVWPAANPKHQNLMTNQGKSAVNYQIATLSQETKF